jgi:hypothetical protein
MGNAAGDPIGELARALRADPDGDSLAALLLRALASAGGSEELRSQLASWADAALAPPGRLRDADVDEHELDRAFAAAEPDLAQMITPDSVAEEAAINADLSADEPGSIASSGSFATRTMADLLERQGDRRGAARIRAALSEAGEASPQGDAAVVATLERWLENVRRQQA